jgi:hypothetical protein
MDLQEPELIDVTAWPPYVDEEELEELEDRKKQACMKLFIRREDVLVVFAEDV